MSTTQVKKLSVATVYGKIDLKELIKAPDETLHVMRVLGCAVNSKTGMSSYGDWTSLLGQFEATNPGTGEVFGSSTLFMPDVALTPILVALAGESTKGVEFALDVYAKYARDAKPGGAAYEYTFVPILPPDANDPVSRLKARVEALALAAPEVKGTAPADGAPAATPALAPAPRRR